MAGTVGLCPVCLKVKQLTRHHLYPQCFYSKQHNAPKLFLCRECHDELHKFLGNKKMKKEKYIKKTINFIQKRV